MPRLMFFVLSQCLLLMLHHVSLLLVGLRSSHIWTSDHHIMQGLLYHCECSKAVRSEGSYAVELKLHAFEGEGLRLGMPWHSFRHKAFLLPLPQTKQPLLRPVVERIFY